MRLIDHLSNAATVFAGVGALAFVVAYAVRSRWWVNMAGRNMMAFMFVTVVLIGLALWSRLHGPLPPWVRFACWLVLGAVIWWRVVILWRVQHAPAAPVEDRCPHCGGVI